jgi:hypothetical protein
MCKILHIVPDEKFTDAIFNIFEAVNPGDNKILVITNATEFKYIKKAPASTISSFAILWQRFAKSLAIYDIVFIHCLSSMNLFLIAESPVATKFVWCGWGADYYDLITKGDRTALLKPHTKTLFNTHQKSKEICLLDRVKQFTKRVLGYKDVNKIKVINDRISYFAPVVFEDYELVQKSIPSFRPQYISWNCGTLEDDLIKDYKNIVVSGENILLGNSASYENNHLDAFDLMKKQKLDGRKIIAPLNYGDTLYGEIISSQGKQCFGENFVSLVDFLPIDQYLEVLKSCSYVVMNHLRQQAMSNIIIMLYMGAKVFLDANNPVYRFFKKQDASIFALEDIESHLGTKLKIQEIEKNRDILRSHWRREIILNKTRNMIDAVMSSPGHA